MPDFEAKIIDYKKILISFDNFSKDGIDSIQKELYSGANDIRANIIKGMQRTKTAPWFYWRGKKPGRKKHYPSAPGEMPARDSGTLFEFIVADQRDMEAEVGVLSMAKKYARFLEEGTDKMEARPFLQPATDEESPKIERNIMKAIERAAEDSFK